MAEKVFAGSKWRGRFFAYAPLIFWITVILMLGSGPGSMAQTSRFIRPLIEFFFPDASPDTVLRIHALIRKTAHFVEYAVLAVFAARAFSTSPEEKLRRYWPLATAAVVFAVACADEFNQSFNPSRTSSGWDVLLDLSGGVCALIMFHLFWRRTESKGVKI